MTAKATSAVTTRRSALVRPTIFVLGPGRSTMSRSCGPALARAHSPTSSARAPPQSGPPTAGSTCSTVSGPRWTATLTSWASPSMTSDDPRRVRMSSIPVLFPSRADCRTPEDAYVHVPHVVFSCGMLRRADGTLVIYYAGNDTVAQHRVQPRRRPRRAVRQLRSGPADWEPALHTVSWQFVPPAGRSIPTLGQPRPPISALRKEPWLRAYTTGSHRRGPHHRARHLLPVYE